MIRITDGHIFLNEYDIAPFVDRKSVKIVGDRVTLVILGDVVDERENLKDNPRIRIKAVKR